MNIGQILETHLGWAVSKLGFRAISPVFDGADEFEIEAELARAWMIEQTWMDVTLKAWKWAHQQGLDEETIVDDDEVRRLYLENSLPRQYKKDLITTDTIYAQRAATAEWLKEKGFNPQMFFRFEDSTPLSLADRHALDQAAIDAGLTLWLKEMDISTSGMSSEGRAPEIRGGHRGYRHPQPDPREAEACSTEKPASRSTSR